MKNGKESKSRTKAETGKAKAASPPASAPAATAKPEPPSKAKAAKAAAKSGETGAAAKGRAAEPAAKRKAADAPPAPAAPAEPPAKRYKLSADQLEPLATGHGACIASDKITVDGQPVRFMYREESVHEDDSGWRFFSGTESDAYMEEPSNHAFYDCNTIANYDRSIVPFLDAAVGSVFEKPPGAADFERAADLASGDDDDEDDEEDDEEA